MGYVFYGIHAQNINNSICRRLSLSNKLIQQRFGIHSHAHDLAKMVTTHGCYPSTDPFMAALPRFGQ